MTNPSVSVIIPAFNEEESIGPVLDEIPRDCVHDVIVVDNGSTDATADVARRHGATLIEEKERGYGAACLRGLAHAGSEADIIVFLDGDHSDYPEELPQLLKPITDDSADFVIGSRVTGQRERGALGWHQLRGNWLACTLLRWLYRHRFTDMGPFRAIRRETLQSFEMVDRTFGWNAEMQAKAIISGTRIVEVPVRYRKRIGKSKISGTVEGTIRAGLKIIATIFRYYPDYLRSLRSAE